jgi:hypothetical protein
MIKSVARLKGTVTSPMTNKRPRLFGNGSGLFGRGPSEFARLALRDFPCAVVRRAPFVEGDEPGDLAPEESFDFIPRPDGRSL